jgi:methionine-rich copper-binding protein CopC
MRAFRSRLLAATLSVAATAPAFAHAMLEHAVPSAGAVLHASPKSVVLSYSEPLEPSLSTVAVTDAQGRDAAAAKSTASGTTMSVALKPLKPGTYRVRWHALSIDTHRTEGAFAFTVAP